MDINILRTIATTVAFIAFLAILVWVWRNRNSKNFKEAKSVPFLED